MPNVYIIGAKVATGGAYMAYHIGRLLARHYGYAPIDVPLYEQADEIFHYDTEMESLAPEQMERQITPEDLMVVNPAYSPYLFGLRLPGRKIMYIQDFRTFQLLDCHCDLYVSVSQPVSRYVHALYGLSTPVIPAFIDTEGLQATPWSERRPHSALVYMKNPSTEHMIVLDMLRRRLAKTAPHIDLSNVIEGRGLSHKLFLEQLGSVRYLVNLSLAEGFGLVPLEAMAMGTVVTGVDGLSGRDYMRYGANALTGSIHDLRRLPELVQHAFDNEALAASCAAAGQLTARHYGHAQFETAWLRELERLLGRAPKHA